MTANWLMVDDTQMENQPSSLNATRSTRLEERNVIESSSPQSPPAIFPCIDSIGHEITETSTSTSESETLGTQTAHLPSEVMFDSATKDTQPVSVGTQYQSQQITSCGEEYSVPVGLSQEDAPIHNMGFQDDSLLSNAFGIDNFDQILTTQDSRANKARSPQLLVYADPVHLLLNDKSPILCRSLSPVGQINEAYSSHRNRSLFMEHVDALENLVQQRLQQAHEVEGKSM